MINLEDKPLRPLRYSLAKGWCDPRYEEILQLKVTELQGTSAVVAPGESYVAHGEYVLKEPGVVSLHLAADGTSIGSLAYLSPGSGTFEMRSEILKVTPGKEKVLSIGMFGEGGADLGARLRIEMES